MQSQYRALHYSLVHRAVKKEHTYTYRPKADTDRNNKNSRQKRFTDDNKELCSLV